MDTPQNLHKGCLYEDHNNKSISFICLDKQCKAISRSACQQCMIIKIHENCKQFLTFDHSDLEFPNLKVQYAPNHKLFNLSAFLYVQEQEIKDKVDKKFDQLLKEVTIQINKVRKEYKVLCLSNLQNFKEQFKDLKNKQENYYDFSILNNLMKKFYEKQTGVEELNQQLILKQQEYNLQEQDEYELENKYKDVLLDYFPLDLDVSKLNSFKNRFLMDLQNISKVHIKKLKPIDEQQHGCLQEENNIYKRDQNSNQPAIFISNKIFKRMEQIIFKLKIKQLNIPYLCLGIISQENTLQRKQLWFRTGNQVCLTNDKQQNPINIGMVNFDQTLKEGQTFIMEVCVKENKMIIRDENFNYYFENSKEFEQDIEDWVIVVGSNQNSANYTYSIQIL